MRLSKQGTSAEMKKPSLPNYIEERLATISSMEENWDADGYGEVVNPMVMERTREFLLSHGNCLGEFSILPELDGSLSLEWMDNRMGVSMMISEEGYSLFEILPSGHCKSNEYDFENQDQLIEEMKSIFE